MRKRHYKNENMNEKDGKEEMRIKYIIIIMAGGCGMINNGKTCL